MPDMDRQTASEAEGREAAGGDRECPRCGSADGLRPIMYGLPRLTPHLEAELEREELFLGGCVVWDDAPTHACRACDARITPRA